MSLVDNAKEWLLGYAIKKELPKLVTLLVSLVTSAKVTGVLKTWGVKVDTTTLDGALTLLINAKLGVLRNWLKIKFNIGWL